MSVDKHTIEKKFPRLPKLFPISSYNDNLIHPLHWICFLLRSKEVLFKKVCNVLITPTAAAAAKLLQSCQTLCDPIDGSLPGSAVPGILQARTLEWVAISFSNALRWKVKVKSSVVLDSSWPLGLQPTRFLHPWDFPGKSTEVGCHCFLYL